MRNVRLLPGELLLDVSALPTVVPELLPCAHASLARLCGAPDTSAIGLHGPALAATVTEANRHESELRLFEAVFGRDSLRVALLVADAYPALVEATVRTLAAVQGESWVVASEEEPGRIPHEVRDPGTDSIARELTERCGWGWPYYGAIDATCLFVLAALTAAARRPAFLDETVTTRAGGVRSIRAATIMAAGWISGRVQRHDGLLCWQRAHAGGIENQVWKDSPDAYFHADGTLANHAGPVASIDTQALAYDALAGCAAQAGLLRLPFARRTALRQDAARVRTATHDRFWLDDPDGGFFALGVDTCPSSGAWRTMAVRSSNVGHLLDSDLLDGADRITRGRVAATIELLGSDELLTPSGLSTIGRSETRWRPGAYHNGSVWLWDTHVAARGLRRHGAVGASDELDLRVLAAVRRARRYPEFVTCETDGAPLVNDRVVDVHCPVRDRPNRVEQPPQELQAWTVASVIAIERRLELRAA